jgi:hypothetical protein
MTFANTNLKWLALEDDINQSKIGLMKIISCGRCESETGPTTNMCRTHQSAYEKERRNRSATNQEAARDSCRRSNRKLKEEMIKAYGGECECCAETEVEFLTLDHIHNDRKAHIKLLNTNSAGVHVYRDLRKRGWPRDKYRLLCMNCNFAIRYGGTCPHQLAREVV